MLLGLLAAGLAALATGMMLVVVGVVAGPLFLPGTVLVSLGLVMVSGQAILSMLRGAD